MTDEEFAQKASAAWHDFRLVELYRGDPAREAAMKDELVNYIPYLAGAVERLLTERAALMEVVRAVAEVDNSDSSVCYQLCQYDSGAILLGAVFGLEHSAPCVVEQARALLGEGERQP